MNVGLQVASGIDGPFPVIFTNDFLRVGHLRPTARKNLDRGYIYAGFARHDLDMDEADRVKKNSETPA